MASYRHPGVYVEELAAAPTINGVETSISGFIGRARRGPVDTAVRTTSFANFEAVFGGLWAESALGHSVRDFFRLGGGAAVIVRIHQTEPGDVASIAFGIGDSRLLLVAATPGAWGRQLSAVVDNDVTGDDSVFNLTVTDGDTGEVETFADVSFAAGSARRVDEVLESDSRLVRVSGPLPTTALATFPESRAASGGSDGGTVTAANYTTGPGMRADRRGLYALDGAELVNLIVVPPYTANGEVDVQVINDTIAYASERRSVMIMDPPAAWATVADAASGAPAPSFPTSSHAAVYFPRLRQPDLDGDMAAFAPSGAVAGVIARTDAKHGVWKAPAGIEATLDGVPELSVTLTDSDNDQLNPLGVNCLRSLPAYGNVVWGARTCAGDDRLDSEWKYLSVRRTGLYIEESIDRGTRWVVFEPNGETTWSQVRLSAGAFLNQLFQQGAFAGATAREAYFVKCDTETTTQEDIHRGIVNIVIGFAPLKPAEFVVITLQQKAAVPKRRWWRRPMRVPLRKVRPSV